MVYGYGNGPQPRKRPTMQRLQDGLRAAGQGGGQGAAGQQPTAPNTFAGLQRAGYARPPRPPRPQLPAAGQSGQLAQGATASRAPMPGTAEFLGGQSPPERPVLRQQPEDELRASQPGGPGQSPPERPVLKFAPGAPGADSAPPEDGAVLALPGMADRPVLKFAPSAAPAAPPPGQPAPGRTVITTPQGQVSEADFAAMPAGTTGYRSAPLNASGTATPDGDRNNLFRGYVSAEGGRFGGDDGGLDSAFGALEGATGVTRDRFGFAPDVSLDEVRRVRSLMGGIANRDPEAIRAGLADGNGFVQRTAQAYDLGFGSQGLPDGADYAALRAQQDAPAGVGGAGGGGAGGNMDLGGYLQGMLTGSPTGYDDAALKSEFDRLAGGIDDDFALKQDQLNEQMAARGLYDSAGKGLMTGRLSDLNIGRRSAKVDLADRLATKRAESLNQGRQSWFDRLDQFGQQAFNNDYRRAAFDFDVQNAQDRLLMLLLGG